MVTKSPRSILPLVSIAGIVAAALFSGAISTAFAAASLTPLGHLPGHPVSSYAYGVSGDGSVVVGGSGFPVETIEAFRWTSGGGMVGLGYLPGSEFNLSYAHGVSGDGSVVVGRSHSASGTQAFRWTSGGGMVGLDILPGDLYSDATGVSGDGSVVVGTSYSDSVRQEAFRWTASGGMQGLGDLPGGSFLSGASGVSADGSVIIGASESFSGTEAFRWTSDGGMVGLGYLPGAGEPLPGAGLYSWASGVIADGSVIVGGSSSASASFGEAFRWTSDAGMVGLGIPPGAFSSSASGVNRDGSVVVGSLSWYPSSGAGTFYWTADGGMRTLWSVLLSHGVDPAADGWTDLYSVGISADGNTIFGFGDRNGQPEAFVAVIAISSPLPGDFNGDNVVDAADYVLWRKTGGAPTGYNDWRANFGATAAGAAAVAHSPTSVPEPAAGAIVLLGVSSILLLRRRSLGRPNKSLWAPGGFRARRQIMRSNVCAFLAILLCTSAAARAFAAASLTPLGDLPGGAFSSGASGVSGDGSVVVGVSGSASGSEAFRWTSDGGMVGLGYLPGGAFYSEARGVSADGSVIVGGSRSASGGQAFRWTSDGGMVGLGDLPGGVFSSAARGVSGDGSVIVGYGSPASGLGEAFRWTSGGGMVGLGDLPGGPFLSGADGVSADGSVVVGHGFYGYSAIDTEAVRWTSGGGMVGLGDLPGGSFYSVARGVSADGSVIVGFGRSSSDEAFRWTSGGGMVGLGTLPGGVGSNAFGVNGDGSIIVGSSQSSALEPGFEAFVWDAENGMRALWDLLLSHGIDPTADGWTRLGSANGISADGNTIVGTGTRNGNTEAFVAVIPISSPLPGDFNGDGIVNAADYIVWRNTLGSTTNLAADGNGNNVIDAADYGVWKSNFGKSLGTASLDAPQASAVPEPAAGSLALLGVSSNLLLRRRSLGRPNKVSLSKREPCD